MIRRASTQHTDDDVAKRLEPEVRMWFRRTFPAGFTPPQRQAVPEIAAGSHVLVSSPTGTGKTLTAFLWALNDLVARWKRGDLSEHVRVVYVSPLKALNNDIERNLREPLEGIRAVFRERGLAPPDIRVGVRTGDTPASERQAMARRPPHILITTPESLAILLASPRFRTHFSGLRYVVVDELHALAESKRGTHLSLLLELLEHEVVQGGGAVPVRVGLSATIAPLDGMAGFLVGGGGGRECALVDVQYLKFTDLQVLSPVPDLVHTAPAEMSEALYKLLDDLIESHRTTLVFTNTRAGTERVVYHLKSRFGRKYAELGDPPPREDSADPAFVPPEPELSGTTLAGERSFVAAHHGSMSRETRLDVEGALKRGELKCVVCSTSLELGIDIGFVDLVILLGSPKGIARSLQRVGRSGHKLGAVSKGRIIALDRDELVESVVLAKLARERRLDRLALPKGALDVLCQFIVGLAVSGRWRVEDALGLARRAYPYNDLSRDDFQACLDYLSGAHEGLRERHVYGKIWFDEATGEFGKRGKLARPLYLLNVGTIPDTSMAKVFEGSRFVGQVSEEFLENLLPGDVFMLGGHTWMFQRAQGMKAYVHAGSGRRPTVPQWYSEQLPLARDLARELRAFRGAFGEILASGGQQKALEFLRDAYNVEGLTAEAIHRYFQEQAGFLGVPGPREVLVEEFVDDDLRRNYVFHTLHGRRTNEALARAFARSIAELKGVNARVQAGDNGFVILVPRGAVLTATELKSLFRMDLRGQLRRALEGSEILKRRFRHVANRALLILRNYAGRERTVGRQQVNAHVLFHVLRKLDPDFPVLREAYREVLEDAFDVRDAEDLCASVRSGATRVRYERRLKAPSPFAHNLVALGSADTVLLEDRKRLVRDLHERVLELLSAKEAA